MTHSYWPLIVFILTKNQDSLPTSPRPPRVPVSGWSEIVFLKIKKITDRVKPFISVLIMVTTGFCNCQGHGGISGSTQVMTSGSHALSGFLVHNPSPWTRSLQTAPRALVYDNTIPVKSTPTGSLHSRHLSGEPESEHLYHLKRSSFLWKHVSFFFHHMPYYARGN